eukprot:528849_1
MDSVLGHLNIVKSEQGHDVHSQSDPTAIKVECTDSADLSHSLSDSGVLSNLVPVGFMSAQTAGTPADMPVLEAGFPCRSCHKSLCLKVDLIRHVTAIHSGQESELLGSGAAVKPEFFVNHTVKPEPSINPGDLLSENHESSDTLKREPTNSTIVCDLQPDSRKKPHKCGECGEMFTRPYGLKIHTRLHTQQ